MSKGDWILVAQLAIVALNAIIAYVQGKTDARVQEIHEQMNKND